MDRFFFYNLRYARIKGGNVIIRTEYTREADIAMGFYIISVSSKYISCAWHVSYIIFPTRLHRVTRIYVCALVIAPGVRTAHVSILVYRLYHSRELIRDSFIAASSSS